METLEKKAEEIEKVSITKIKATPIKTPAYKTLKGKEDKLRIYDMAEYSCDATCDHCHCATY